MKILLTLLTIAGLALLPSIANADSKTYSFVEAPRQEPTGCPYGDSIPLDSEKCVAPAIEQPPVIEIPLEEGGK